jgi:membrane protein YdbS with pleckstrin-like domain
MAASTKDSDQEIWRGRPWIVPYAGVRTILVAIFAAAALFLEISMGYLYAPVFGSLVMLWTLLAFLVIWIIVIFNMLVLRSTHLYILRADSLEIKTGLLTTKTSVIVPTGFSDLEVIRSISSRIFKTGNIIIKTQSEKDYTKKMVMVKDPMLVANLIRDVMARQIFKLDERSPGKPS